MSSAGKSSTPWLIAGFHLLSCAGILLFVDYWPDTLRKLSPTSDAIGAASLLVCVGADVCLLGLWAALSPASSASKWLATLVSAVCWCGIYAPDIFYALWDWPPYVGPGWQYRFFSRCASVVGLPLLVVCLLTCSLSAAKRRGIQFRPLSAEEAAVEGSSRNFQLLHLLLLVAVVSLYMSFSQNCRHWLSYEISMRWRFAGYAPIQSAETVLMSALLQATGTLVLAWAALTYGHPWPRLLVALAVVGLFGFDWAFAFTNMRHREHLVWNGLFSVCVAMVQAILISAALLVVRRRGYRLVKRINEDLQSSR